MQVAEPATLEAMTGPESVVHVVSAEDDPALAPFRRLKDATQRSLGNFIIESERVLERMIELGTPIESVLVTPSRRERVAAAVATTRGVDGHPLVIVADPEMVERAIGFALHRGVVAIARRPSTLDPAAALASARRVVVLEDVVDPDNVGSVFRHAAAFGAGLVVLSEHAGDPLYRKAVRTSMGWVLDVPWMRVAAASELVPTLHRAGFTTIALTPSGDVGIDDARLPRSAEARVAVLLGSEHDGLREATLACASHRVRIPIAGHVDSLNVATAAAIAMFSLFR